MGTHLTALALVLSSAALSTGCSPPERAAEPPQAEPDAPLVQPREIGGAGLHAGPSNMTWRGGRIDTIYDVSGRLRGLAVSVDGERIRIDAKTTAEALAFIASGRASTDFHQLRSELISNHHHRKFVEMLRIELPSKPVALALMSMPVRDLLLGLGDPSHQSVAPRTPAVTYDPCDATVTATDGGAPVSVHNTGLRFVEAYRRNVRSDGTELAVAPLARGVAIANSAPAPALHGAEGWGAGKTVLHLWDTVLCLQPEGDRGGESFVDHDGPMDARAAAAEYWVIGPGFVDAPRRPASIPDPGLDLWGATFVAYVLFPVLEFVSEAGELLDLSFSKAVELYQAVKDVGDVAGAMSALLSAEDPSTLASAVMDGLLAIVSACSNSQAFVCKEIFQGGATGGALAGGLASKAILVINVGLAAVNFSCMWEHLEQYKVACVTSLPVPSSSSAASFGASLRHRISAGNVHTCVVTSDSGVSCWGDGVLHPKSATPHRVERLSNVVEISSGHGHVCSLGSTGDVRCWGFNGSGELGQPSPAGWSFQPIEPADLPSDVTKIAAGGTTTCAIGASGALKCWGRHHSGTSGDGELAAGAQTVVGATAIASGGSHSCAIVGGAVRCWGANQFGQLGRGTQDNYLIVPPVSATVAPAGASDIASSRECTCALASNSTAVTCWGWSYERSNCRPAHPPEDRLLPLHLPDPGGSVAAMAMGTGVLRSEVCVVLASGAVRCWDRSRGSFATVPTLESGFVDIAVGAGHACALHQSGRVMCWGRGDLGQLGHGKSPVKAVQQPVAVVGL